MHLGTVGTGWITEAFIEASKETGQFTLTSVYSRTIDKANAFAEKHGATHAFADLEDMAASKTVDVVYIASPNSHHFRHVLQFLKGKKHVICEKPIFSNLKEWEEAYRVAEENGVFLFEAMRNLHTPNFNRLQEGLEQIGTVRSMILPFVQYSSRYDKFLAGENPNVFTTAFSGGALTDLGVYPLSIAVGLFGKPANAVYFPVLLDSGVDGSGTLILNYPGFTATILCSKIAQSANMCEIHGEKGTVVFENTGDMYHPRVRLHGDDGVRELPADDHPNNMVYEAEAFAAIIKATDTDAYERLKKISYDVLTVTEKVRHENGIIFDVER
ncbi:Gfo/Idh/MocA family oxidoreductase [Lentibacillus cibarius]|uniref:Gfo/Idh/MocA family oxidoreductase n=1 Tax=Lentibacillus cibarius TaxID=2583219 RepID=A0A549YEQ9_9BACI|nr:Gfo/Idh/MocA family oxidoreductase [Lentibacillus cibarius]TMN21468.1 Gfo/Idh/MocA family oxidoreductase [Lentibacillus cibarius]TRM10366.1 Gfo/Idh/MocA family oxidoreductase [Lentibacillus cibarius]